MDAGLAKRKGDNRWLWTVVFSFGMLSFAPFIWAAVQVRSKSFRTAALVSVAASAFAFVTGSVSGMFEEAEQRAELRASGVPDSVIEATASSSPSWAVWAIVGVWVGMSLYALYLNPEYVRWRAGRISGSPDMRPDQSALHPAQPAAWSPPAPHSGVVQYITVNGGVNNFNTQSTSVQAGGSVSGISGSHVEQSAASTGLQPDTVLAFIAEYRAALVGLDSGTRQAAVPHLDQLVSEMSAGQPNEAVINQHLRTLKALAHHALSSGIARAATAGGSAAMSALLAKWPFG